MPWMETHIVDTRTEFVLKAMADHQPFTTLCKEYGISTKTGYKWKERFQQHGITGLADESRRPKNSPSQLDETCVCRLIRIKGKHDKWGPKKVRNVFARSFPNEPAPSLSSVKRILDKAGFVKHRKRRKAGESGRIENDVASAKPNDLWTVDFKGSWRSSENERIEPLTVRDACSRYVFCAQTLADGTAATVQTCFDRLFETYGMPWAIHSDNGPPFAAPNSPFGLSGLSAWWIGLGITLNRSRPGKPQDNGGHERMHRDIADEVESVEGGDLVAQQAALDVWREAFNTERPHEALGMQFPSEVYTPSERAYPGADVAMTYPSNYLCRRVHRTGYVKLRSRRIFVTSALRGWDVGLETRGGGSYALWFGSLCLGLVDMASESFQVWGG